MGLRLRSIYRYECIAETDAQELVAGLSTDEVMREFLPASTNAAHHPLGLHSRAAHRQQAARNNLAREVVRERVLRFYLLVLLWDDSQGWVDALYE